MADETSEEARDILGEQSVMETARQPLDEIWDTVAEYCAPDAPIFQKFSNRPGGESQAERENRRQRRVYDTTIISAVKRLSAGLESLVTPQSEKWHSFSTAAINDQETDEEKQWAEMVRDLLFDGVRYQANANFVPAMQQCYRNVIRFGPAYLFPSETTSGGFIRYQSIPVNEGFIARDKYGLPEVFHRRYQRSAFQIVQIIEGMGRYPAGGKRVPSKIKEMANDRTKRHEKFTLLQAIGRKPDGKRIRITMPDGQSQFIDMPWQSQHIIEEEEFIAREGGFSTFPVACFSWEREEGDDYGTSACIEALTVVKEQNAVRKSGLRALNQNTDPATASVPDLDVIPVLHPGANYPGLLSEAGDQLIKAIHTGADPRFAFEYADKNGQIIQNHLFVNLFQILVDNPEMTATQALLRNQEKGELLGPTGSVVQGGLTQLTDRELAILETNGLYAPDSIYLPPPSLEGKTIKVSFTSPLDVLRRSAEASDTIELVMTAAEIAKATGDTSIMDVVDGEESLRIIQSARRAPMRALRTKDAVDAIRAARAQEATNAKGMAALEQGAKVVKDIVPAAVQASEAGLMPTAPAA